MGRIAIKAQQISEAYQKIKNGGLSIIPSRVGYTLLGNTDQAIQKMYKIKGRPLTKPCVVLTNRDILEELAEIPAKYLPFINAIEAEKLLCGFILKRKAHKNFESLSPFTNEYSKRPDGTSCFVINAGEYIQYLIDESLKEGTFVVGSSANKSGTGNEGIFAMLPENIKDEVDVAIEDDAFVQQEYNPKTREQGVMVNLTGDIPIVTRKGLKFEYVKELLEKHAGGFEISLQTPEVTIDK